MQPRGGREPEQSIKEQPNQSQRAPAQAEPRHREAGAGGSARSFQPELSRGSATAGGCVPAGVGPLPRSECIYTTARPAPRSSAGEARRPRLNLARAGGLACRGVTHREPHHAAGAVPAAATRRPRQPGRTSSIPVPVPGPGAVPGTSREPPGRDTVTLGHDRVTPGARSAPASTDGRPVAGDTCHRAAGTAAHPDPRAGTGHPADRGPVTATVRGCRWAVAPAPAPSDTHPLGTSRTAHPGPGPPAPREPLPPRAPPAPGPPAHLPAVKVAAGAVPSAPALRRGAEAPSAGPGPPDRSLSLSRSPSGPTPRC